MPYATNPTDGVRTYFDDADGNGPPVVLYSGFAEPLEHPKSSGLAHALHADYRLIFADHRGHGRSDKPHDEDAYALVSRVADATAVLDELGIERAHFIGFSWGARLGYAIGEHAPGRVTSLVLCGNQPYAWDLGSPLAHAVSEAIDAALRDGMRGFVDTFESLVDYRFPEPLRSWTLENDPEALHAAFRSVSAEGAIARDLGAWLTPCLIYAGETDEMHDRAERAAAEIPGATFLSLPGHTHLSAPDEVDQLLPHILDLFRSTTPS